MTDDMKRAAFLHACEQWAIDNPDTGDGLHTAKLPPLPKGAKWWDITQARGRLAQKAQAREAYRKAMPNGAEASKPTEPAGERAPNWPSRIHLDRPTANRPTLPGFLLEVAKWAALLCLIGWALGWIK